MVSESFIDMCAVCKQGVSKDKMTYQKGLVFHQQCFDAQGNAFPSIDQELAQLSARTKIELVQMKNLKARTDAGLLEEEIPKQVVEKKKPAKKSKAKKSRAKPKKAKRVKKVKKRASKRRR